MCRFIRSHFVAGLVAVAGLAGGLPCAPRQGLAAGAAQPATEDLKAAQALLRKGAYEEAIRRYEQLAVGANNRIEAAIGVAEALRSTGRYAEAMRRLDAVDGSESDRWHLARAEVLAAVGRYPEAIEAAGKAISLDDRNTTARRLSGQLYEMVGQQKKAVEAYAWFEALLRRSYPSNAIALTDAGVAIFRHAVLTRSPQTTAKTKYVLQELLQPAGERVDKQYWRARLAAADLLLGKYNIEQAAEEYKAALAINPNLVEAHVGLGAIELSEWHFEKAVAHADKALKINPGSAAAHCLHARIHLTERRDAEAADSARKALQTNPNHVEGLGILAAVLVLQGDGEGFEEVMQRIDEINPRSAVVPNEVAAWLAQRNQFPEAEPLFKKAAGFAPEWADPLTGLGLLYMETGDEAAARRVLDASWKLDPFNEKTFHTLNLLDKLEKFGHEETEHFIVKSADGPDAVIRPMIALYCEGMYERICRQFDFHPPRKTIVEVFPDHQSFAVRITARPFLHTIGATTGPVIALDAPRSGRGNMTFNWPRVLGHELVHTVTLAATQNRLPRWLTEGLAQREEGNRRTLEWRRLLAMAMRRGQLYDLESIEWGFARPQRRDGPRLAYAQSDWMVEYILDRYGQEAVNRMLVGFRAGRKQAEVLPTALGVSPETLMKEFKAYAAKDAERWGLPLDPIPPPEEIDRLLKRSKGGERVPLLVARAEAALDDGSHEDAAGSIREALKLDARNPRVLTVMIQALSAQLTRAGKDDHERLKKECLELARSLADLNPKAPAACWVLGRQAMEDKESLQAIEYFTRIRDVRPTDIYSRSCLADLYIDIKLPEKALAELTELASLAPDEESHPLRAARIHVDAGQIAEAVEWYRKALLVVPYDKDTHDTLGQLLIREQRFGEAVDAFRILTQLDPASPTAHSRLAFALHRDGRVDESKTAARRAVSLDPKAEAKSLLEE